MHGRRIREGSNTEREVLWRLVQGIIGEGSREIEKSTREKNSRRERRGGKSVREERIASVVKRAGGRRDLDAGGEEGKERERQGKGKLKKERRNG